MSDSAPKSPTPAAGPSSVPARIGRYEVLERVGSGSSGTVYRATDPFIGRILAIPLRRDDRTDISWLTENQIKVSILSNHIRPRVAIVDPTLTHSCPPKVTADSGIDALTHAIEAYTAVENAGFALPHGEVSV